METSIKRHVIRRRRRCLKPFIAKLMRRQDLSAAEAEQAMQIIMTGQATDAQIGGYLVALRMKGETVAEITGSARAMRAQASQVPYDVDGDPLLDTAERAGTARTPSTFPPLRPLSSPGRGARWPSTATAPPPRAAAAPMCSMRWASTWI